MTELVGRITSIRVLDACTNDPHERVLSIKLEVPSRDQPRYEDLHCGLVTLIQKDVSDEVWGK